MAHRKTAFFTPEPRDAVLPLFMTGIGLRHIQQAVHRPAGYDGFHFFRCTAGEGLVSYGQHKHQVRQNMAMILYPHEPHHYEPVQEPWQVDWITFKGHSAEALLSYIDISHSSVFELLTPDFTAAAIQALEQLINTDKPTIKLDLSGQLYNLLGSLCWNAQPGRTSRHEHRYGRIRRVLQYIEQHYDQPLTLELLADQAGVSARNLCLLFRDVLHMRPFWYVNTVRINRCKQLLLEDRKRSISDIACQCGFTNICYFNQTFRTIAGMSPTQFRAQH